MTQGPTTLILGWGNPGRGDDGLGPAFVAAVASMKPPAVALDADYQLSVEDAAEVARFDRVVFVDAARRGEAPFAWRRLRPSASRASFSTHSVAPEAVLALSRDLFRAEPEAWLLAIRGYDFDRFCEELSPRASANLSLAVAGIAASWATTGAEGEVWSTPSA